MYGPVTLNCKTEIPNKLNFWNRYYHVVNFIETERMNTKVIDNITCF